MKPLDIGDMLVDPGKSSQLLHYIGKAAYRYNQRELAKKKVKISLDRLKKISTKELKSHLENLEDEIHDAMEKSKLLKVRQEKEDKEQTIIQKRIKSLNEKLEEYLKKQEKLEKRLQGLETEAHETLDTRKEKISQLREDLKKLTKIYNEAKKSKKYKKKELESINNRINLLKKRIKDF